MDYLVNSVYIFVAIVMSALLSSVVVPNILVIAHRKKLFDMPDDRKAHTGFIPRLGGVAFTPIILLTMTIVSSLLLVEFLPGEMGDISSDSTIFIMSIGALLLLYLIGLKDDLVGVRYNVKFKVQIVAGTLLFLSGLRVTDLCGFLFLGELNLVMSYLVTIFLVVFIINSINLIDGIDGLASGLSIIASIYYGITFILSGDILCAMLSFTVIGTLSPFFHYNVFGKVQRCRKIFMGDTGSLTIGLILSVLSIKALSTNVIPGSNGVFVSFAPLIVPCFDVVRVAVYRLSIGKPMFQPDRNHIHHKFLDAGLSGRRSLILILLISLVLTFTMVVLSKFIDVNLLFLLNIVIWVAMLQTLKRFKKRHVIESEQ